MKKGYFHYYQQLFTFEEIEKFKTDGAIIDATRGGLLLGPSHEEGGIYFLFQYSDGFRLYGELEGFEYIVKREAILRNRNFLKSINNRSRDFTGPFINYHYDSNISIIDARSDSVEYNSKYIILDVEGGFGIVNKYSTKRFLNVINDFNNSY